MSRSTRHLVLVLVGSLWSSIVLAADARMVRISYEGNSLTGRVLVHAGDDGWFLQRDGRLAPIVLSEVHDYEVLGNFRPFGTVELRERLTREFGNDMTVSATGHYLVVAPSGLGSRFGRLFEDLYREFVVYFAARGFRMRDPEFPLVAIVFPNEAQFHAYCKAEGVQPQPGLRGYYLPTSNRVALYDTATSGRTAVSSLDHTIIHEAVHQVAFNTGIHSRVGTNPQWVVEGLATVFENAAVRRNDRNTPQGERVNVSRLRWFQQHRDRWPLGGIAELIADDQRFQDSVLDAYSQAWALSFYLMETRSADYTAYLRKLAQRNPLEPYPPAERLRDFQTHFGNDLSLLETRLRRFCDDLSHR